MLKAISAKFTNFMRRLVAVPHSEIKAKLDAEKRAKTRKRKARFPRFPRKGLERPFLPPCQSPPQRLTASPRSAIRLDGIGLRRSADCLWSPDCCSGNSAHPRSGTSGTARRNVGSIQSALQQAPEVFKAVGVHAPVYVVLSMVDNFMHVIASQSVVGRRSSVYSCAPARHVSHDLCLQAFCFRFGITWLCDLAAALKHSHDGSLSRFPRVPVVLRLRSLCAYSEPCRR